MEGNPTPKRKGGRKPILDPELVAAALAEYQGNVSTVAKKFRVARSSVMELVNKRPSLKTILHDAREGMLDNAESALHSRVLAGEGWAVCFCLKTIGRKRGYTENEALLEMQGRIRELRELILSHAKASGSAGGTGRTRSPGKGKPGSSDARGTQERPSPPDADGGDEPGPVAGIADPV